MDTIGQPEASFPVPPPVLDGEPQDKIGLSKKIRGWPLRFQCSNFNIGELQSAFLDEEPQFRELRAMIAQYNDEIKMEGEEYSLISSGPSKLVFFQQLLGMMRQLIITRDRKLQKQFLNKIYKWTHDMRKNLLAKPQNRERRVKTVSLGQRENGKIQKTDQSLDTRLNTTNPNITIISTRPNTTILQEDEVDFDQEKKIKINEFFTQQKEQTAQPSWLIEEAMKDYRTEARTIHQSFDPPKLRLQDYKRRQLNMILQSSQLPSRQPLRKSAFPGQYEVIRPTIHSAQVLYKGSRPSDNSNDEQDDTQDLELLANEIEKQKQQIKVDNQTNLAPKIKAYVFDRKQQESQTVDIEQSSNYTSYKPRYDTTEMIMEQRWLDHQNRNVRDKKEDQEIISMMLEWSKSKQRVEKEIQRRIDQKYYGNEFVKNNFKITDPNKSLDDIIEPKKVVEESESDEDTPKVKNKHNLKLRSVSLNQKYSNPKEVIIPKILPKMESQQQYSVERQIDQQKIRRIKQNCSHILQLNSTDSDDRYVPLGLSAYDRKIQLHRNEFSKVLSSHTPNQQVRQQLEEIQEIKQRMAKYKINVPINRLLTAIVVPGWERNYTSELPQPGYGLMENPMEEEKKSKQKKKK